MIITIDGPSGTGKTTVAKALAKKLHYDYFDTGAMYRAVSYGLLQKGISCQDEKALSDFLEHFDLKMEETEQGRQYLLNGQNVTKQIRSLEVTAYVSEVAAKPIVRAHLVKIQKAFAQARDTVFEGRDMGTVVFPKADLKIFLTARPEVRAFRRYLELATKVSREKILNEIEKRDQADSNREHSPLRQAEDAYLIDTSELNLEEIVDTIMRLFDGKNL
ncbi:MAG: (d)CMP kinase [Verrucomicrobia bacterium]|nr:(d)CMP kinase [Verrucomicrobiota bacterium]MBS0646551.1 (d)CMP kinase [Verrucomicrobiota bacterium]